MTKTQKQKLDRLAKKISKSTNLWDLHEALCNFEAELANTDPLATANHHDYDCEGELLARKVDLCWLPTFGGDEPSSTVGVWSWDKDSILVGEGSFQEWKIRDRE